MFFHIYHADIVYVIQTHGNPLDIKIKFVVHKVGISMKSVKLIIRGFVRWLSSVR